MTTFWIVFIIGFITTTIFFIINGKKIMELLAILGGSVAAVFIILFAICYGAFVWGLVFWKFWYWFLLPVFPNYPAITFVQAVGLMLVVSLFKNHSQIQIKKEYKDSNSTAAMEFLAPLFLLGIGWLFKVIFL